MRHWIAIAEQTRRGEVAGKAGPRTTTATALVIALLCLLPLSARAAEDLVSGVSTDVIEVRSDFTGTDVVVFGAIEDMGEAVSAGDRDVVVVLRGPEVPVTVRRKDRVLGLWVNTEQVPFVDMPGYYYLASSRPIDDIAPAATLARFQLGTAHLAVAAPPGATPAKAAAFRAAVVRNFKREQLYGDTTAIDFLSASLFRARVPLPAVVPAGNYRAEVYLVHRGIVVAAQSSPLFIDKTGVERQVYNFAYQASLAYGVFSVMLALGLGWLGYALFRQRGV